MQTNIVMSLAFVNNIDLEFCNVCIKKKDVTYTNAMAEDKETSAPLFCKWLEDQESVCLVPYHQIGKERDRAYRCCRSSSELTST